MEENIHDDKLDDYVRKSFEGHEEEPPADMWARVENDLMPPVDVVPSRATYLRYGWQALAAVVILVLFSMLVCEHLYYEEKLREMTGKPLEQQEMGSKRKTVDEPAEPQVQSGKNSRSAPFAPGRKASSTLKANLEKNPAPESMAAQHTVPGHLQDGKAPGIERNIMLPKSEASVPQDVQGLSETASSMPSAVDGTIFEPPLVQPKSESNTANQVFQTAIEVAFVPISSKLLEIPDQSAPVLRKIPIKPWKEPSGWYVGGQTSLLTSIEKPRALSSRPGRPVFSNNQEDKDVSAIWWLKTGKKINARFSLESGFGYQKMLRTATHTPRFRFGDGIHAGGPWATRRTFNYDLSTYGGTAEVSLRMDQTTSGPPVSDDEPVSLKITTSERTELLRIPMLAGYRLGSGRWQGQMKAGLVGNVVLKNELEISARISQNTRFQPVVGSDGYTVQLNQKKFFLGYWLSAGTVFKLNQHLHLVAESALVGDFPRNDRYSRRLPQRFMLGLNVGANYYF